MSPIFSHFPDQREELSKASEGWQSQGNDAGTRFPGEPVARAPAGAARPSPREASAFRLAPRLP